MIDKIANQSTSPDEVLALAEELFSGKLVYLGPQNPQTDEMVQNILLALIKKVRQQ